MTDYSIVDAEEAKEWAISPVSDSDGGEKVEAFWEASPEAAQHE